jgi:hypothetical protein
LYVYSEVATESFVGILAFVVAVAGVGMSFFSFLVGFDVILNFPAAEG